MTPFQILVRLPVVLFFFFFFFFLFLLAIIAGWVPDPLQLGCAAPRHHRDQQQGMNEQ